MPWVLWMRQNDGTFKIRQEQMLKMHDLSNKILAETDPKKQQALKDQQLELIKAEASTNDVYASSKDDEYGQIK